MRRLTQHAIHAFQRSSYRLTTHAKGIDDYEDTNCDDEGRDGRDDCGCCDVGLCGSIFFISILLSSKLIKAENKRFASELADSYAGLEKVG